MLIGEIPNQILFNIEGLLFVQNFPAKNQIFMIFQLPDVTTTKMSHVLSFSKLKILGYSGLN